MASYRNATYGYSLLYPTGWTINESNPAQVTFAGPGSSSIVVNYELDNTKDDATAYKAAKVQAFQAIVTGYATVSESRDNASLTWKVTATYTQGTVAKKGLLFVDYPKPRGFFIVLSAAASDYDGLADKFNQALASWQVPAVVK